MLISITIIIVPCVIIYNIKKGCTVEATAIIEKNERHHSYRANRGYHKAILGYDYNGVHYISTARTKFGDKEEGHRCQIKFDPNNPQKQYRKADLLIPQITLGVGILMTCISMIYAVKILFDLIF